MIKSLLRCEWKALCRDKTFWIALLVFGLLMVYGFWNGARWVQFQRANMVVQAQEMEKTRQSNEEFFGKVAESPNSGITPWHSGIVAYQLWPTNALPPAPLAATAIGQSDMNPLALQARTRFDVALAKEEIENPVNLLTGRFDLAFVIVYLLPLLIIGLSYNVLSGEREAGTLPLALSQPVSLRALLLIKMLVRALPIGGVVVLTGAVLLALDGANFLAPAIFWRFALWAWLVTLYGAFWLTLVAAVNAWGWNSATNASALAGFWLTIVIVVPALITSGVGALYPAPPRLALTQTIHRAEDEAKERGVSLLQAYYRAHPDLKPAGSVEINDYWTQRYAMNDFMERKLANSLDAVDNSSQRTRQLSRQLSVFSPALLTQQGLCDIAGSGDARYSEFLRQTDSFRASWRGFFLPRVFRQTGLPLEQWDSIPQFRFQEESIGAVAFRLIASSAILLALTLGLGISCALLLRRNRVFA